ncbi:hypothetical protein JCGZ_26282 [Jatropha curcas]|uniref:Major facilitator superfamily (MFS) profile domain-containing protein n=1 Tax=Jatropha curcas TaxID=180498 RepID=A0A067JEX0_JATCU|nr:hypothetical protein JCGZ_26282 [Jatropha curcas]
MAGELSLTSEGSQYNGRMTSFVVLSCMMAAMGGVIFGDGHGVLLAGWVVVMTVFVHLLLPETKNMPIEKMEIVWREHWFWKRIVGETVEGSNKFEAA